MEANKSKYSCASSSCGKPLFSEVKFCPYCAEPFVSEESKLKSQQEAQAKAKQELALKEKLDQQNAKALVATKIMADQGEKQVAEAFTKSATKIKKAQEKQQVEAKVQQEVVVAKEAQKLDQDKSQEPTTKTNTNTSNKTNLEATSNKPARSYEVKPEDKKNGSWKWLLIFIILGVVGFYGAKQWAALSSGSNICEQTITDVTGMLATGDANGALIKIKEVLPECTGEPKTRLLDMQKAANKALRAQTATCNAALSKIEKSFNRRELLSARKALDKLPANCESFNQAKNLKEKIVQKEDLVKTAEADFDSAISANNFDMAKIALNKLQEATREHANLERMRSQLDEAIRNAQTPDPAPVQVPTPAPVPVQNNAAPVNHQQSQPQVTNNVRDWVDANRRASNNQVQAPAPANLPNNPADIERAAQNRMTQTFMAEAQNAVQQKRFDVARTQVQNALRVDPNNKDAQLLLRRINELQLQSLRNQTTID